jgi:hypothetical protein
VEALRVADASVQKPFTSSDLVGQIGAALRSGRVGH